MLTKRAKIPPRFGAIAVLAILATSIAASFAHPLLAQTVTAKPTSHNIENTSSTANTTSASNGPAPVTNNSANGPAPPKIIQDNKILYTLWYQSSKDIIILLYH